MESKALELLALQLDQLAAAEGSNLLIPRLKPRDVEQIYQAREILLTQWLEPPSVCKLAQQVKCDRKKLLQQITNSCWTNFGCEDGKTDVGKLR